jgi:hypothetical protein
MKRFLLALLIFNSIISVAQKCDYDKDEIDKFTKSHKLEKEVKVHGGSDGDSYLTVKFCKYDSLRFFRITWIRKTGVVVGRSDKITFLFDNEETIQAHPTEIYSSNYRTSTNQQVLYATYSFDGDYEKLSHNKLKSIRITYNQNVYKDSDIKDKFQNDVLKAAQCVFN